MMAAQMHPICKMNSPNTRLCGYRPVFRWFPALVCRRHASSKAPFTNHDQPPPLQGSLFNGICPSAAQDIARFSKLNPTRSRRSSDIPNILPCSKHSRVSPPHGHRQESNIHILFGSYAFDYKNLLSFSTRKLCRSECQQDGELLLLLTSLHEQYFFASAGARM
jgi:hypothetical protein